MNAKTKAFMFGVALGLIVHYGYTQASSRGAMSTAR